MIKYLELFTLFLYKKYNITPNDLTYIRIFSAPWLALLIGIVLKDHSFSLAIITIILYSLMIVTDLLDGILAREISKTGEHDHFLGGMIDRIGDKLFVIFMLIPFGLNLFTITIILGESILAWQAINATGKQKQAGKIGKVKMVLQTFLIPILLISQTTSFIPDMLLYFYIILTLVFTYASVYFHYFKHE